MKLPAPKRDARAERDADAFAAGTLRRAPSRNASTRTPGRGEPLPPEVRAWAQPRLGIDLEGVRVRDDAEAHAAVADRGARALTAGEDVLFADGEYRPGTPAGHELLLHELAHVAQQREAREPRTQHQDPQQPAATGIGRTPPDADFAVASLAASDDENASVLFTRDHVDVEGALLDRVRAALATHSGAVVVRIHGYASTEGDRTYNVNLSAHRAVAVRDAILALLPAGSAVRLIAHGETLAFGDTPDPNRRVGIGISDMPAEPSDEERAAAYLRRHPLTLGGGLHLDVPQLPPPGPATTRVIDWTIGDPNRLLRPGPAPYLAPLPVGQVIPNLPFSLFAQDFRMRGVPFTQNDQSLLAEHWARWYPLAQGLWRFGFPVTTIFDSPNDLMTTFTRKLISSSLSGDHPDAIEAFDQQLARAGISTPIYVPLPYGTWQFDTDFRNWSRPKIK